ncbi:MAG: hypothetical protein Q8L06_06945 [Pseudohongiella sp.]|nr:hypothetical protein [Pseudohongiella sp.]
MLRKLGRHNKKRKLQNSPDKTVSEFLANNVQYGGNPEHKRNPGDFGLTPPSAPRAHKSLCDDCGVFKRANALGLLREGCRRGLVSTQTNGDWPQNLWAVTEDGYPVEAQLENSEQGIYHGYPMPESDPFRDIVLSRWQSYSQEIESK